MIQVLLDGATVLTEKWTLVLGALSIIIVGGGTYQLLFIKAKRRDTGALFTPSILILVFLFTIALILRLAFLKEIYAPPYFDSVEHYKIIKRLVILFDTPGFPRTLSTLIPYYYHLGFHFLVAFLILSLQVDSLDAILVLGQVILAVIPLPMFFLVRNETRSNAAGFLGWLLAGFGWYMPGFAVNWGKYPALAGLLSLSFVWMMAHAIAREKNRGNCITALALLLAWLCVSFFLHSRTLVVAALSLASWRIALRVQGWFGRFPAQTFILLVFGMLAGGWAVYKEPMFKLALDPYLGGQAWLTLGIFLLAPFALKKHSTAVYFCLLFICSLFVSLYIPVPGLSPVIEGQTLLDRPFVEIILFFPMAFLGGLGWAGLMRYQENLKKIPEKIKVYGKVALVSLSIIFLGTILVGNYVFTPSDCCNYVKYNDTVALDWLNRRLPASGKILVAATNLSVGTTSSSESLAGADAGIWILPLTGRKTTLAPYNLDFSMQETRDRICQQKVDYVYVGGSQYSFNTQQLQQRADWYSMSLNLPGVKIFQVTDCD